MSLRINIKATWFQVSAAVVLLSVGAAAGLVAAPYVDSVLRVEQHRADLSGAEAMEVIVSTAEYKPGAFLPRHSHHGLEAVYVAQGATVQAQGKPVMVLAEGKSLLNLRDVDHAGFQVVGDHSLKLFTVHIVDKGKPLYVLSK